MEKVSVGYYRPKQGGYNPGHREHIAVIDNHKRTPVALFGYSVSEAEVLVETLSDAVLFSSCKPMLALMHRAARGEIIEEEAAELLAGMMHALDGMQSTGASIESLEHQIADHLGVPPRSLS